MGRIEIPETGVLASSETYQNYLEANPETAGTIHPSISAHYPRPKAENPECHRSHRLKLAKFDVNHLVLVVKLNGTQLKETCSERINLGRLDC